MRRSRLGVVVAAAAWCGCGLGGSDEVQGAYPGDGASGFGRSSPIELCVGTARVVPAAGGLAAAAVCIDEGAEARACASDGECSGIERCVCGRCIVRACQGAAACAEGEVCRGKRCTLPCTGDAECGAGNRCISGGCARACSSDAACHFGERCDSLDGTCVARLCSDLVKCGSDERCEAEEITGEPREPDIVQVGEEAVIVFVEVRAAGERAIYRARIDAPGRWSADPPEPVVSLPEGAGAPAGRVAGETIELFFEVGDGARIAKLVSEDGGETFPGAPLEVLAPGVWEAGRVASPALFELAGSTYLAYEGGQGAGVGLARIDASGAAVRVGAGPIVVPATVADPVLWRAVDRVGAPYVLVHEDIVRFYVTARGAEGSDAGSSEGPIPADLNDSIGLVTSRDLVTFQAFPTGPVLARVTNLRAYLGEREPVVRLGDAGAEITFIATDAAGSVVTGLASAR